MVVELRRNWALLLFSFKVLFTLFFLFFVTFLRVLYKVLHFLYLCGNSLLIVSLPLLSFNSLVFPIFPFSLQLSVLFYPFYHLPTLICLPSFFPFFPSPSCTSFFTYFISFFCPLSFPHHSRHLYHNLHFNFFLLLLPFSSF